MEYLNIIEKLENNEHFAFSRWGDGEFMNIEKVAGANCDGNVYYPDLGDKLHNILLTPVDYFVGVQTLIPYAQKFSVNYPQNWSDADVFHRASIDGKLNIFIEQLNKLNVAYIGNKDLIIQEFVDVEISIPEKNVWLDYDNYLTNILDLNLKNHIILLSAGMAANVFIHDLWSQNKENTYIDVGSVFDPYVGKLTRSYHRNLNL